MKIQFPMGKHSASESSDSTAAVKRAQREPSAFILPVIKAAPSLLLRTEEVPATHFQTTCAKTGPEEPSLRLEGAANTWWVFFFFFYHRRPIPLQPSEKVMVSLVMRTPLESFRLFWS